MFLILLVATVFLVSIAWAQSLAHALELPGKLRLDKDSYIAAQTIYYPGFTIAGAFGEGLGMLATLGLLIMTGTGGAKFPWILIALVALIVMHALYWIITHPLNKFWMKDQHLEGLGAGLFSAGKSGRELTDADPDDVWRRLRNRWEYSHFVRAAFAGIALIALSVALAL